jgi:hypothetical protein
VALSAANLREQMELRRAQILLGKTMGKPMEVFHGRISWENHGTKNWNALNMDISIGYFSWM